MTTQIPYEIARERAAHAADQTKIAVKKASLRLNGVYLADHQCEKWHSGNHGLVVQGRFAVCQGCNDASSIFDLR